MHLQLGEKGNLLRDAFQKLLPGSVTPFGPVNSFKATWLAISRRAQVVRSGKDGLLSVPTNICVKHKKQVSYVSLDLRISKTLWCYPSLCFVRTSLFLIRGCGFQ
jgi:hypothetical protein